MNTKSKIVFVLNAFLLVLISIQVVIYAFIWQQLLTDPSLRTMDFIAFYGAGRLMREGDFAAIYDIDASRYVQREVVESEEYEPLLFNHPPFLAPILALIADDDYVKAYQKWSLVRFVIWVVCLGLIRQFLLSNQLDDRSALLGALSSGLFFPIFLSFLGGQDTIFSLLGLLIWMFALLKKRDLEAGLGLAFATHTPTIAGALFLPLLISNKRAGMWFMVGGAVLGGYSMLMMGGDGISKFLMLLRISSEGTYYGFGWENMYNLLGLLLRFYPNMSMDKASSIIWIVVLLVIVLLSVLWKRMEPSLPLIGFSMVAVTFSSPHLHVHGLSYLILPLIAYIVIVYKKGYHLLALLLMPILSIALLITEIVLPETSYYLPYLLMIMLLVSFAILLHREANTAQ